MRGSEASLNSHKGGLEEIIKSWIGTGPNKAISPNQLQQALGAETVEGLSRETGMPRDDCSLNCRGFFPRSSTNLPPRERTQGRGPTGN